MRILITHPSKTSRGGIFNATLLHAIGLKAIGHDVVIATGSEALVPFAEKYGVPVIFDRKFDEPLGPVYSFGAGGKLRKLGRLDAVIHQGGKSWIWGRLFFPGAQHSVVFHTSKISLRKYFKNWLVLSKFQYQELANNKRLLLKRNIQVVKNGFFPVPASSNEDRKKQSGNTIIIGSLAEIRGMKRFDMLIDAVAELRSRGYLIECVLGGEGSALPDLQQKVFEKNLQHVIHFPGWFNNVSEFYDQIDVFCLPSDYESFGIVLLEAMSAGVPVMATKTNGALDIITHKKNGLLVNVDDLHDLARSIQLLLDMDESKRIELAENGKVHAEKNYGFEAVGRSLEEAIYNFASQKSLLPFGRSIKKPG